jgi:hypothetical protein
MRDTDTMRVLTSDEIKQVSGGTAGEGVITAESAGGKAFAIGSHPPLVGASTVNPASAGVITAASAH